MTIFLKLYPNVGQTWHVKKACLVWLKGSGVWQIASLKQRFLSFTLDKTQRSYKKIVYLYLFHWFSGENCIIRSSQRRCFGYYKKVFLKILQNSQENTCARHRSSPSENPCRSAISLKSHFGTGVLLWTCCIFSEHIFLRTPLDGWFWPEPLF